MSTNCAKACGTCGGSSTATTTEAASTTTGGSQECFNTNEWCDFWAAQNYCNVEYQVNKGNTSYKGDGQG